MLFCFYVIYCLSQRLNYGLDDEEKHKHWSHPETVPAGHHNIPVHIQRHEHFPATQANSMCHVSPSLNNLPFTVNGFKIRQQLCKYSWQFSSQIVAVKRSLDFPPSCTASQIVSRVSVMSTSLHLYRFTQQPRGQLHPKMSCVRTQEAGETLVQLDIDTADTHTQTHKHTHTSQHGPGKRLF